MKALALAADQGGVAAVVRDVHVMTAGVEARFEQGPFRALERAGAVDDDAVAFEGGTAGVRPADVGDQHGAVSAEGAGEVSARVRSRPAIVSGVSYLTNSRLTCVPNVP